MRLVGNAVVRRTDRERQAGGAVDAEHVLAADERSRRPHAEATRSRSDPDVYALPSEDFARRGEQFQLQGRVDPEAVQHPPVPQAATLADPELGVVVDAVPVDVTVTSGDDLLGPSIGPLEPRLVPPARGLHTHDRELVAPRVLTDLHPGPGGHRGAPLRFGRRIGTVDQRAVRARFDAICAHRSSVCRSVSTYSDRRRVGSSRTRATTASSVTSSPGPSSSRGKPATILRSRQPAQSGFTWVSRSELPDGSRNPESMPYGMSSGASVNSTPRATSFS